MLSIWKLANITHDTIRNVMYAFASKNDHDVWKERWYTFTSRTSLQTNLYTTCEDQVFVVDRITTNPTREMMATNVIN
jgi:hypothetical protein